MKKLDSSHRGARYLDTATGSSAPESLSWPELFRFTVGPIKIYFLQYLGHYQNISKKVAPGYWKIKLIMYINC